MTEAEMAAEVERTDWRLHLKYWWWDMTRHPERRWYWWITDPLVHLLMWTGDALCWIARRLRQ